MLPPYAHGFEVDREGHLLVGGVRAADLADRFGTPLYALDETRIRSNCREYREALRAHYPGPGRVLYASKALCVAAVCQVVWEEGLGVDVVSVGEIHTALKAGLPPEALYFHGSNKTADEVAFGLEVGVGRFVVDNAHELSLLGRMAHERGRQAEILLRLAPGIEPHTHKAIQTGGVDSKFGFGILGGSAREAVVTALTTPGVRLLGLHCHIGSQILDVGPFVLAARSLVDFAAEMRPHGFELAELNLGGGLGIRYLCDQDPPPRSELVRTLSESVVDALGSWELPLPRLLLEPGRSIVGDAGITVYTAGAIKAIPGIRTFVSVDGGMYENPRPALYGARYEAVAAARAAEPGSVRYTVAGRCCESGDILIWDASLPQIDPGDLIAVFATGAYNYSMAGNYNRYPRPAMVFAREGAAQLVVERESALDLTRHDRLLEGSCARVPAGQCTDAPP